MGRSQRKQFWVPSMVVTAVIAVVVCAWALSARSGVIAGEGKEHRLGLPPLQRFGSAYGFRNLSAKQVRALARAFSQAEKLVLWLPNPESGQGEQVCLANVIITPGRNWAHRRRGVTEATSPHFTVIDTTEPVPGSSWILEQTAVRGYREGDVPLGIQGFFKTERLAVGRVPAFFVDEWDPLPGKGLPSGLAAKSYRLRRFSLTWVEQGTQVSVHYGDENTTPEDARKRVLKLAAALHAVDASDALAKELRELLRSSGAPR